MRREQQQKIKKRIRKRKKNGGDQWIEEMKSKGVRGEREMERIRDYERQEGDSEEGKLGKVQKLSYACVHCGFLPCPSNRSPQVRKNNSHIRNVGFSSTISKGLRKETNQKLYGMMVDSSAAANTNQLL